MIESLSPQLRREAEFLQRTISRMNLKQLKDEAQRNGYTHLLHESLIASDRSSLCAALLNELLAPWEENDDSPEVIDAWLASCADPWPPSEPRPIPDLRDQAVRRAVLDPKGREWGLAACGVRIDVCDDNPAKGRGAFATRVIEDGAVVGIYAGELIDQRTHALRHAVRGPLFLPPNEEEEAMLAERKARLEAIGADEGAPISGADNRGGYSFTLLPDALSQQFVGRYSHVDAEDPHRSSWPRYVNHASDKTRACNVAPKVNGLLAVVWLQARRRIEPGEELCFDYGPLFDGGKSVQVE